MPRRGRRSFPACLLDAYRARADSAGRVVAICGKYDGRVEACPASTRSRTDDNYITGVA
jgi:hypothetical protein